MRRDVLGVHAGAAPLFEPHLETPTIKWTIRAPAIEDPLVSCFQLYSVNVNSKTVHHLKSSVSSARSCTPLSQGICESGNSLPLRTVNCGSLAYRSSPFLVVKFTSPRLTSSRAMLVFRRLSGWDSILAAEPLKSCLLLRAATTIRRKCESIF